MVGLAVGGVMDRWLGPAASSGPSGAPDIPPLPALLALSH